MNKSKLASWIILAVCTAWIIYRVSVVVGGTFK